MTPAFSIQGDQSGRGQKLESTGFIGGVIGQSDERAVRQSGQIIYFVREDAHGNEDVLADIGQFIAFFLAGVFQERRMLHAVHVQFAFIELHIRLDVIAENDDLDV